MFQNGHLDEVSVSTLNRLDAVVTDAVDNQSKSFEDTIAPLGGSSSLSKDPADKLSVVSQQGKIRCWWKEGRIPHESPHHLKSFLTQASSHLLSHCHDTFLRSIPKMT